MPPFEDGIGVTPEREDYDPFELYNILKPSLRNARKNQMEAEFLQWMLDGLKVSPEQLREAIRCANWEWDL